MRKKHYKNNNQATCKRFTINLTPKKDVFFDRILQLEKKGSVTFVKQLIIEIFRTIRIITIPVKFPFHYFHLIMNLYGSLYKKFNSSEFQLFYQVCFMKGKKESRKIKKERAQKKRNNNKNQNHRGKKQNYFPFDYSFSRVSHNHPIY